MVSKSVLGCIGLPVLLSCVGIILHSNRKHIILFTFDPVTGKTMDRRVVLEPRNPSIAACFSSVNFVFHPRFKLSSTVFPPMPSANTVHSSTLIVRKSTLILRIGKPRKASENSLTESLQSQTSINCNVSFFRIPAQNLSSPSPSSLLFILKWVSLDCSNAAPREFAPFPEIKFWPKFKLRSSFPNPCFPIDCIVLSPILLWLRSKARSVVVNMNCPSSSCKLSQILQLLSLNARSCTCGEREHRI
mmetsp:Transcript_9182/g.17349  ORF Transcript_9182/g.17349 Transcript_9182/m.17349 type:complete len:246 (+) Transcript_9182:1628-2365(+)